MKSNLLSVLVAVLLLSVSCKKTDNHADATTTGIDGIAVSDSFDWNTTSEINFSIGTSDSRFKNLLHTIYIYDQNPNTGGKILAKGSATLIRPFNTKVAFAKATKSVYIVKSAPNGLKTGELVTLNSVNISISFGESGLTKTSYAPVSGTKTKYLSYTNFPTNNPIRFTDDPNIVMKAKEQVYFFSEKDVTIDVEANSGGVLKIYAPNHKINIRNFNHTNLDVIISDTTTVTLNSAEIKANEDWINDGTLEISGKLDLKGTITNNKSASIGFLQINASGVANNNCRLFTDDLQADNILNNYNYAIAKNTTRINSNGRINLIGGKNSGAYFETKDLLKGSNKGQVFGTNATSLFKITGSIDANLLLDTKQMKNSQIVAGTVNLCTSVENIPEGFFSAPAVLSCDAFIAKSDCMPVSNGGSSPDKDSDGDGVIDQDDDYKDDKTKAYNTYSVNYNAGGSTLAFEDNWPAKGDYDLNDLVISYRYMVVTNAENKVVELNAKYSLIATGADYINGAGIQFPLIAGQAKLIKAPAGVYIEDKQDSVVLILFNDSRKLQATGNTVPGSPVSAKVDFNITFEVKDGPEIKNFGAVSYNPFIWNATNGFGRGYETHLFGKNPTNLANKELFGTKDDYSKPNHRYYSTKEKLPWVIEVPIADFGYPIEGKRIDQAYTNFSEWARSSGNNNLEWYKILSGGANNDFIYTAK
ncbi:MAG TPA: LruC domain-containing protein [Pedobacter sp.]|nr:LruC domain-containing protein [Pedobacter sp.]